MTYSFRLQRTDGSPADPPTLRSTVLTWRQGDTTPLGADRTLRVLGVRDDDADSRPCWLSKTCRERPLASSSPS